MIADLLNMHVMELVNSFLGYFQFLGTKSGYHAITYGWLVDQIVRRADPLKRGIGRFFREEIAVPYGISIPDRLHFLFIYFNYELIKSLMTTFSFYGTFFSRN